MKRFKKRKQISPSRLRGAPHINTSEEEDDGKWGQKGASSDSGVSAGGQVDEGEDVELNEDGETKEDCVHHQTCQAQAAVQDPLIQMHTHNLVTERERDRRKEHGKCL